MRSLHGPLRFAPSLLLALACAHYPVNPPLRADAERRAPPAAASPPSMPAANAVGLVLGFSGGGSRAAAVAYGVLEELARTEIPGPHGSRRLLDEVDVISAVSGGSFTAAYYALRGDGIFEDFETRFLTRDVQNALLLRTLAPWNWIRLASPHFGRSELAAEYYDRILFEGARFADLGAEAGPGSRPVVVVQATDLAAGARFDFTPTWFEAICSDLAAFPVSRAVAASSALPGLLSPVTLVNHAGTCGDREREWVRRAIAAGEGNPRRFHLVRELRSLGDAEARPYVHLLDGGIADNLGLRAILDAAALHGSASEALRDWGMADVGRLAFVIIDAQAHKSARWSRVSSGPSTRGILSAVTGAVISRYNLETVALLREWLGAWRRERAAQGREAASYLIEVRLEAAADVDEREALSTMSTSLRLAPEDVGRLRRLARDALRRSDDFRRLLEDLRERSD